MSRKWTLKYGLSAVLVATVVISVAIFANQLPSLIPGPTPAVASFLVMLTDPPTVPAGTTVLDLTYSNVSLHVAYANGTSAWLPLSASGTVNLFSLVNMTQTIASTTIPTGSAVDKIQFTIAAVDAKINGTIYKVTALSSTLLVSVANSQVNQTLSGVLVDFNPTLVQIQATDLDGNPVYYYVLVPSATATVVTELSQEQVKVGTIVELRQNNKQKLVRVVEEFSNNLTITSASLSVKDNVTTLSVTIMNKGNIPFRVFGLTLNGEFNITRTWEKDHKDKESGEKIHPETIPFKINGSSLIPLFGNEQDNGDDEDKGNHGNHDIAATSLTVQTGQSAVLSFSGVIGFQPGKHDKNGAMVLTPIVGGNYTIKLTGEGLKSFSVTAKP